MSTYKQYTIKNTVYFISIYPRNNLNEGMKPREVDTDTIGGKAINQYANLAQKVSNSSTARTTRKIYDVSKATSQNIFEKGDKK